MDEAAVAGVVAERVKGLESAPPGSRRELFDLRRRPAVIAQAAGDLDARSGARGLRRDQRGAARATGDAAAGRAAGVPAPPGPTRLPERPHRPRKAGRVGAGRAPTPVDVRCSRWRARRLVGDGSTPVLSWAHTMADGATGC
ncbi:hypothetical protein Q3W71_23205 [Micromonospora sp. C28SCA-DRY-2]|uniref:hypothetical protein n=1 Tax=Micromonospora sp. C28SCA-DRY-2 TaxID=3059522 RepID=UPI002675064B|nr:hypothetical protein [Micromonospora sp. C28SCA-DRY-2]MDO3704575.1 hypothetical protein [Micromonospora sp. C28SCA-DRY-2]